MLHFRKVAAALMLAGGLCPVMAPAAPSAGVSVIDSQTYTHANQLVRIDGQRRLNMLCMGHGAPTVVLQSGGALGLVMWRKVQGRIAAFTRVCSYDRAGLGFSDPISRPSDADNTVDDLHRLLQAARITGPVVMTGHSQGGLFQRLYAARYPKAVAGLVFVDSATLFQTKHSYAVESEADHKLSSRVRVNYYAIYEKCFDLAIKGTLSRSTGPECLNDLEYNDSILQAEDDRQQSRLQTVEAVYSEQENNSTLDMRMPTPNEMEAVRVPEHLGHLPLVVLEAGRGLANFNPPRPHEEEEVGHADAKTLAHLSANGKYILVPDSTHDMPNDAPDAVVAAIHDVVAAVRSSTPHRRPH